MSFEHDCTLFSSLKMYLYCIPSLQMQLFSHSLPPHFWHRGPCCPNEILMKAWGCACVLLSPTAVLWHAKNKSWTFTVSGKVACYYFLKGTNAGICRMLCQHHYSQNFCCCPICITVQSLLAVQSDQDDQDPTCQEVYFEYFAQAAYFH